MVLQPILGPIQTSMLRGTRLPTAVTRAWREHERIREAVAARDPAAARAAMRAHMRTAAMEIDATQDAVERLGSA